MTGRAHSSPLPMFFRIPLPWLQSTTYAFYPDELHSDIRRVFTPRDSPHTKRHFCGFCGTPLSHWSEENPLDADKICLTMGSLSSESLNLLGDIGLLPSISDEEVHENGASKSEQMITRAEGREIKGQPWFEDIIEGSELGKIRRRRGGETDGSTTVEWEVFEFNTEDRVAAEVGAGKRKLEDLVEDNDISMAESR